MADPNNSKEKITERLIVKYGENFKTPLAKDLGVDVSTVRRLFNCDRELPAISRAAILWILNH